MAADARANRWGASSGGTRAAGTRAKRRRAAFPFALFAPALFAPAVVAPAIVAWAVGAATIARTADAEPDGAWKREIAEGIAQQDREIARSGAKPLLARAQSLAERNPDVVRLYLLARVFAKTEDHQSAIQTYGEAIEAEPNCHFAWRDRGILYALRNDPGRAESDLRRAVALAPTYVEALQPLGGLLLQQKRPADAIPFLVRAVDADPSLDSARGQLMEAHLALGQTGAAMGVLRPMLARAPNDPNLGLFHARILIAEKKYAEGMAELKRISDARPEWPTPVRHWLDAAASLGKVGAAEAEEAISMLERLRRMAGTDAQQRTKIQGQIDSIRAQVTAGAQPAEPAGPPTAEQIAAALRAPDQKIREHVLTFLVRLGEKRDPSLLQGPARLALLKSLLQGPARLALVERLDPVREPVELHRRYALIVLEVGGDPALAPLVRASLRDEVPDVRTRTADVLGTLGNPLGVAVLFRYATGKDLALAVAARAAVYSLARVKAPLVLGDDPSGAAHPDPGAQAAAFRTWWTTAPEARRAKHAAIAAVLEAADVAPWDLLFPLTLDEDPEIWPEAYRALVRVAGHSPGRTPREAWLSRLPVVADAALVASGREAFLEQMSAWWLSKPAS